MLGAKDLFTAPRQSFFYGLAVAILMAIVSLLAWYKGSQWIMFAMIGGFVFLAPLTCIGLYAISAQLERQQPVSMRRTLPTANFRMPLAISTIGIGHCSPVQSTTRSASVASIVTSLGP